VSITAHQLVKPTSRRPQTWASAEKLWQHCVVLCE